MRRSIDNLKSGFPGGGMIVGRMAPGDGPAAPISIEDIAHAVAATGIVSTPGQVPAVPAAPTGANPTATAKDTAVNGSAVTFMRSDGAPAIQKATSSQFGLVQVDGTSILETSGVIRAVGGAGGSTGLYSQVLSATPTAASTGLGTWLNQGTATVADAGTGVALTAPAATLNNIRGRYGAVPATPYTRTALITTSVDPAASTGFGVGWYDGTNKLHILLVQAQAAGTGWQQLVARFSTPTTFSALDYTGGTFGAHPLWVKLADDGTNISFATGHDGANFVVLYTVAKASGYLGATGYSNLILFNNPGVASITTLMSWA